MSSGGKPTRLRFGWADNDVKWVWLGLVDAKTCVGMVEVWFRNWFVDTGGLNGIMYVHSSVSWVLQASAATGNSCVRIQDERTWLDLGRRCSWLT